jgi:putative aldouronate transport system permease protein
LSAIQESRSDKVFNIIGFTMLFTVFLLVAYPLYFVVIASISDPSKVSLGDVWLIPKGITMAGYQLILENEQIWNGYKNTILYTTVGTFCNLAFTLPAAYALSRKDLVGRNIFMYVIVFTMFFSGGLIPTYLLVKSLGLYNTFWAMILPSAVSAWNLIIARTYFQTNIPKELEEAAEMDGCSDIQFFIRIALPLSKAIIAVMALFYAVSHWNEFFKALIYLKDQDRFPLQLVLRDILIQNEFNPGETNELNARKAAEQANLIKYGVIIVASVPVLILYPFIQKYFVKGVMLGSIKD